MNRRTIEPLRKVEGSPPREAPRYVLFVDDARADVEALSAALERALGPLAGTRVDSAEELAEALGREAFELVVTEHRLRGCDYEAVLAALDALALDVPLVVATSRPLTAAEITEALRGGAQDVVSKREPERLCAVVERELRAADARRRLEAALRLKEEELAQSQKLEAVGTLIGSVAHDFNNILSVVMSFSHLAREELPEEHPARADLDEILRAAGRAAGLSRQLLGFSRRHSPQTELVDVNQLVADMEPMLRRLVGEHLDLAILAAPTRARVRADPGQLEQVVLNLVVNARDAMPGGGRIIVETSTVVLDEASAAQYECAAAGLKVALKVSDSGCGIPPELQRRIFEPFFTTKDDKGTGLGLSTVKEIVRRCGGAIWVESEVGQGSCFVVCLPGAERVEAPRLPTPAAPSRTAGTQGTETVLLVEDDDHLRNAMHTILRRRGYRVLTARNGGDAFLICEEHDGLIDLLITDVVFPRLSGPLLARRLERLQPGMRILYTSGYPADSLEPHGLPAGARLVAKPVPPGELLAAVRDVLDDACAAEARV